MDATLLIYSGRPNPRWRIDETRAHDVRAAIAAMAEARASPPESGGLGYSGVELDFTDAAGTRRRGVFADGSALIDGKAYVDAGLRVERALLASGREQVPEISALLGGRDGAQGSPLK